MFCELIVTSFSFNFSVIFVHYWLVCFWSTDKFEDIKCLFVFFTPSISFIHCSN